MFLEHQHRLGRDHLGQRLDPLEDQLAQVLRVAGADQDHAVEVTGDFDCVILVRARDADHLRELVLERIQSLPEVVATQTVLVFEEHVGPV